MNAGLSRDRLDVTGLPARAADTAGESVVGGHLVAERAGSVEPAASANSAYVHGVGVVLLVCGTAALPAAAFLPGSEPARETEGGAPDMVAPAADARQ